MKSSIHFRPRLVCSFCGAEIGFGHAYWQINGRSVCSACLPEFARAEYAPFRRVRGSEAAL